MTAMIATKPNERSRARYLQTILFLLDKFCYLLTFHCEKSNRYRITNFSRHEGGMYD